MTNMTNGTAHDSNATNAAEVPTAAMNAATVADGAKKQEEPKLAEVLAQLIETQADLFHDPRGVAYGTVSITRLNGGVVERTMRLRSKPFRTWVAYIGRKALRQTVGTSVIDEALLALEGTARFDRSEQRVHVRVAEHGRTIYIDLGDETGDCVEVDARGWRFVDRVPVRFLRPDGLLPLARPIQGGQIEDLRPFVNVDDDGFILLVAWLVGSYWPDHPCAALGVTGEQGTTKSSFSRLARKLTDPNVAALRAPPRNEDDLIIAACNSHVVAFDNVSGLAPWLSDGLCRLITGGGVSKRTLYSDEDETILQVIRPVLVNGIEDIADRPDLAERCIALTLAPIAEELRRDEESYWRDFDAAAPRILGALFAGVAAALATIDDVHLSQLPRMADFAKWTAAAESGLGFVPGTIAAAYERNRTLVVASSLDASPVASALRTLLEKEKGEWKGTPADLLKALNGVVEAEVSRSKNWPKAANSLSARLRRAATALRQSGVAVEEGHKSRGKTKERWLTITTATTDNDSETISTEGHDND